MRWNANFFNSEGERTVGAGFCYCWKRSTFFLSGGAVCSVLYFNRARTRTLDREKNLEKWELFPFFRFRVTSNISRNVMPTTSKNFISARAERGTVFAPTCWNPCRVAMWADKQRTVKAFFGGVPCLRRRKGWEMEEVDTCCPWWDGPLSVRDWTSWSRFFSHFS